MAGGGIPQSQNPRVQLPVQAPVPVQAGFSAGMAPAMPSMNSPFRGGMSTTTGMTGTGGYSGGVQAMREGGVAKYEDGGVAKSGDPLDEYRYFTSAQDAYNRTLAMGQSQAYRDWYYSLDPVTRSYGAQPPATGPDDPMWIYLAQQAQNNYEVFDGTNPFTGQPYAPPTTSTAPSTGTGTTGTGTGTGTAPSSGSYTQPGTALPLTPGPSIGGTPIPKPGSGVGYGAGTGTGTWGGGSVIGGGGGTFTPPPSYTPPEFPNLAFGYQWVPEELKTLRAQVGLVPGGGGISTVPPAASTTTVATKSAKEGGIMSLMGRNQ